MTRADRQRQISRKSAEVFCAIAICLAQIDAFGREIELPIGTVTEVKASLDVSVRSVTNVFQEDSRENPNTANDLVFTISPGINITYPKERITFDLAYRFDIEEFLKLTDENTINKDVSLGAKYFHSSGRFSLDLRQSFADTKEARSKDFASNPLTNRADRKALTTSAGLTVDVNPFIDLTLDVSRGTDRFDDRAVEVNNSIDSSYAIGMSYKIWARTSLEFDYDISETRFPDAAGARGDSTTRTFQVGFGRDITARISGSASIGVTQNRVDDSLVPGSRGSGLSTDVELSWAVRNTTSLGLTLSREFENAAAVGAGSFIETTIGVNVTQALGQRISLGGDIEYSESDYESSGRSDQEYSFGLSASYRVNRWLSVTGHYDFDDRKSTDPVNEFKTTGFGLSFTFAASF